MENGTDVRGDPCGQLARPALEKELLVIRMLSRRIGAIAPVVVLWRLAVVAATLAGISVALPRTATRLFVVLVVAGVFVTGTTTRACNRERPSAKGEGYYNDRDDDLLHGASVSPKPALRTLLERFGTYFNPAAGRRGYGSSAVGGGNSARRPVEIHIRRPPRAKASLAWLGSSPSGLSLAALLMSSRGSRPRSARVTARV